jgi:hypothetical protein
MGREMARLMLDAMHAPRRVILTTELRVRLSSGPTRAIVPDGTGTLTAVAL